MSAGVFEKLVLVLTALSVLFVGGTVGLLTIMPMRSGVPDVAVDAAFTTQDWLAVAQGAAGSAGVPRVGDPVPWDGPPAEESDTASGGDASAPTGGYYDADGQRGSDDPAPAFKGFPWIRRVPRVVYAPPRPLPEILYRKYRSFEDAYELTQSGGGKFTTTESGEPAYQLTWLAEESPLATRLGLQKGDEIVSINGQPVGNSPSAGKALYDQLKGETEFAVLVERGGERVVLSYYVDD